jgi:intracellular sulfur oxidation DsrE/DsrF family protein
MVVKFTPRKTCAWACSPTPAASKHPFLTGLVLLALLSSSAFAESLKDVLELNEAPPGVVFEIVEAGGDSWYATKPMLLKAIDKLHAKFAGLDIVVVSHGSEQFALTKKNQIKYKSLHDTVKDLGEKNIHVHVCGVHASWRSMTAEDFPDYVDVAPSGPAQINQYRALGYVVIDDFAD